MAKSSAYWQKRFQMIEDANNQTAKKTVQAVTPAFDQAQAQIEKEINAWYARFAKNNEISLTEAKKLLNTKELKEFRWDVEEYIKYGRQNALDQAWMKQLENASARFHISRLEALKIRTQNAAEQAFGNELDQLDSMAAKLYMDDYYHTAYEIQRGLGIGWDVSQIDQRKLDTILSKPWTTDKQTFSDRIWKSKTQLVDSLHTELTRMCVLGKAPDQTINTIAKRMNVSKGQAGRLVMTEAAYFGSVAQKDCFNDLDVEFYEIVATLDNRTSDVCQEMDGKVFKMSDFQAGVTAPPFHVWCRSCTAPWFEDNDDGTRAARGADGKTYQVPASMKYDDWKQTFVNGGSKDGLTPLVDVEALKKKLADKQSELMQVGAEINIRTQEQTDFLAGLNDPAYKKLHDMSDEEFQMWNKVLKDQERAFTAEMDEIYSEYQKVFDRPARNTPERAAWDKWHEEIKKKYGVDHATELYDKYEDVRKKRSVVRDEMNDAFGFSGWKARFQGKTKEFYEEELFNLTKNHAALEAEIKSLTKQIDDAIKAQAEAAYSAKTLREIQDEIIKKHDAILKTDIQKQEFADIIEGMTKEQANFYQKMSVNFDRNDYHRRVGAHYSPSGRCVNMDIDRTNWEKAVGRSDHGAWKTKFHEELHQVDHVLGWYQKSPFARTVNDPKRFALEMTHTATVTGSKMIQAIDDDVLIAINHAIDVKNATYGLKIKRVNTLNRISREGKDAFLEWLTSNYSTSKDRALISVFTDAVGLTTKGNLHPWKQGFWGHDASYCKRLGKDGATSEVWAELCAALLKNDKEQIEAFTKLMPNTVKVYSKTLDEVMEWAKTGSLEYKKP